MTKHFFVFICCAAIFASLLLFGIHNQNDLYRKNMAAFQENCANQLARQKLPRITLSPYEIALITNGFHVVRVSPQTDIVTRQELDRIHSNLESIVSLLEKILEKN